MVCPSYCTDGKPKSCCDTSAIASDVVICITAPNNNCGFIDGIVINHNSCHLFLIPSIEPASYSVLSTDCKPAMKARNDTPKDNHNWTIIITINIQSGSLNHRIGLSIKPKFFKNALA